MNRHLTGKHLVGEHLMDRYLMVRHLVGRSLMGKHPMGVHLMGRHLIGRRLTTQSTDNICTGSNIAYLIQDAHNPRWVAQIPSQDSRPYHFTRASSVYSSTRSSTHRS
jgi:hypothetical protein